MNETEALEVIRNIERFFEAMDYVFRAKDEILRRAADQIAHSKNYHVDMPLSIRYTLNDGKIWEPYYDQKNDKHGWRLRKFRTVFDWLYRRKHGHDKDFVETLPEGPVRKPAYFLEELWSWNFSIDPAIHYLMLKQECQRFHTFMLLAHMRRPQLEQRLSLYEDSTTFTNGIAHHIGDARYGIDWNSIPRFHAEVMEAMKTIP